jgi:hypothetical protein
MFTTHIDTLIHDLETGESKTVTQKIDLRDDGVLVYTVPGGKHEVLVNAEQYLATLRALTGL